MTLLNASTMASFGAQAELPLYDRGAVRAGIVHIGVGGFHRAHHAMYIDRLMNKGEAMDWGICGVGLLPRDARMRDVLLAQDCLYTLVLKHPDGTWEPRVIGSIVDYLYAPDDPDAVIEKMADPSVRIVSMTVTEGGYNIDPLTHQFDLTVPAVVADLDNDRPATVFGLVSAALDRRRRHGVAPFTVLSCDNVSSNGQVARTAFTGFARAKDTDLAHWVGTHVRFPNSMVDRITPQTTDEDRAAITARFGIADGWPVVAEPFSQWVLEDNFSLGRPRYEDAGVQVVDDVEPYEMMKLRLLNAGHQVLGCLGYLAGYRMLDDVARDPLFAELLMGYLDREGTPTLRPVPGVDLADYKRELLARFSNAGTGDTVARICTDVSDRIPTFLVPVVRDQLASGGEVGRAVAVVAGWARYAEGVDEQGQAIEVVDRRRDALMAAARRYEADPLAFVRQHDLFGDLAEDPRFARPYLAVLASLHARGVRWTIANLGTVIQRLPPPSQQQKRGTISMKAVLYDAPRSFAVQDVPRPEPGPQDILVKVLQSGICGTDLHIHEGHFFAEFPLIPGHEVVGTVEAMGAEVVGFAAGEAVAVNPNINCGHCEYCRSGRALLCPNLKGMGTNWPGSFAEYLTVPYQFAYSVEGIDPDVAVFTEPAACAMHGLESLDPRPGTTALIFGAGPTGLLLAQLLVHGGAAHVTVAAPTRFKLDRARALGVDETVLLDREDLAATVRRLREISDGGFDVVVEATGSPLVGEQCVPLTRNGGTVLVYGVTEPADRISFSPYDVFRREITIRGSFAEINSFAAAIRALRSGRIRTTGLITHRFTLDEYAQALKTLQTDKSAHKIVVTV